jgi:aryl-alcohol dehydrogenase-like predicted oxidoreductase
VLLGPAGVDQLTENLRAGEISLTGDDLAALTADPEDPDEYWAYRSGLPWQ